MLSEYIWKIDTLECFGETDIGDNYVTIVHWNVQKTQDGVFAKIPGKTSFKIDINQSNFIPYNELTEDVILSWVWEQVNKTTIESHLDIKLQNLIAPKIKSMALPWAN